MNRTFWRGNRTVLMIEPPNGKSYGFPKPCPPNWALWSWEQKKLWYIANNYPESEIEKLGENFKTALYHAKAGE